MIFHITKDGFELWRWILDGKDGHHLAVAARPYTTRNACLTAIREIADHVHDARVFEA